MKWRQSLVMTEQWRFINGAELYNIINDRGQCHDISSESPDIVLELRMEYEKWWDIVSTQFDEMIPISSGNPNQEVSCIHSHNWRPIDYQKTNDPFAAEDNEYLVFNQS
ncbi:MAG: hypothetical protein MK193_11005 [Lentisphaeria bacterium]|nr:hypothetical protein [Lentisphaeria bacterium]